MEYIYTALLLDSVGQKITEVNVKKVLKGAGVKVDDAKVKALISALKGVNIKEIIEKSAIPVPAAPTETKKEEKVEKKKEEAKEEKKEEAASGLASLFG